MICSEGVGISVMKPFSGGQLLVEKQSPFGQALTPLTIAQEIAAVRAEGLEGFTLFSLSRNAEKVLPVLREGPLAED